GRHDVLGLIDSLRGECTVFMSTHILADVERVCDTVGILARGRLVAQAPREALLAQYAQPVFEFESEAGGEAALAEWAQAQGRQSWVEGVSVDGRLARLSVTDVAEAREALLASAVGAGLR